MHDASIRTTAAPLRHCMVVCAYYPLGEPRVQREADALVEAGFEVDVICLQGRGEPDRERYRSVDIHRLPLTVDKRSLVHQLFGYLKFAVRAALRLTRLNHVKHYRTVQVHNLPDFLVFCALVPKMMGVPLILDLHDLMPEFFAGRFGMRRPLLTRLIAWQEKVACRFADHVVTVSDHWKDALVERGVKQEKISVVMNVADEKMFRPRRRAADPSEFTLIYHGTVAYRYGLDLALRAVALVRGEVPTIRMTILGTGDLMPELFDLRRRLGLQEVVELRDELVLVEELQAILETATLGVVPYRNDVFTDGLLPTKLMEYAAIGLPSVASRTTAIESHFRDSMVEFFHPGDVPDLARCLRELHSDPDRLSTLARRSARFTSTHNWARIGSRYVEVVRGLAERH